MKIKLIFRYAFTLTLVICMLSSCKKEESSWSEVPEIKFISISPSSLVQFSSPLTITIEYRDGDGDLGENSPDVVNTFVTDSRNNLTYQLRTQQLAPDNANIAITGRLNIEIPSVAVIGSGNSESFTYSIYLTDRKGNRSNTITTSSVTVTK
ncbi:MAG: hypothetical protein ACK4GL_03180 [Flavobacteriales bacterium]